MKLLRLHLLPVAAMLTSVAFLSGQNRQESTVPENTKANACACVMRTAKCCSCTQQDASDCKNNSYDCPCAKYNPSGCPCCKQASQTS